MIHPKAVFCIFFLATAVLAEKPGSLMGAVKDKKGNYLPGARITVELPDCETPHYTGVGRSGFYHVDALHPGTYQITAYYTDCPLVTQEVTITSGTENRIDFTMDCIHEDKIIRVYKEGDPIDYKLWPISACGGFPIDNPKPLECMDK